MTARRVVLAAVAICGCGPSVLWSGHTADRRARLDLLADHGVQHLDVDGTRGRAYLEVAPASIATAGEHVAFAGRLGARWWVDVDGRIGSAWDGIGEVVVAADGRAAYVAEAADGWHAIVDGAAGPAFAAIRAGTLQLERAGCRVAYVGVGSDGDRVVVDARIDARFDGVGRFAFSRDGHDVYVGRRDHDVFAVVDGVAGPAWSAVGELVPSPRGGHVAYAAWDGEAWHVVVDGEPGPTIDRVDRIIWSADGAHLAWVGHADGNDVVVEDGVAVAAAPHLRADTVGFGSGRDGAAPAISYVVPDARGEHVAIDGVAQPTFDEVGVPSWSRDGRLAYAARRGARWSVMSEGRELAGGTWVADLTWSADGKLAFLTRRTRGTEVVVDGRGFRYDLALDGSLAFSTDGAHWAVIAGELATWQLFFAVDGRARVPLSSDEIYSAGSTGAGGDRLMEWSRAEADRAAGARPAIGRCTTGSLFTKSSHLTP